jgi:hypothetical protein
MSWVLCELLPVCSAVRSAGSPRYTMYCTKTYTPSRPESGYSAARLEVEEVIASESMSQASVVF